MSTTSDTVEIKLLREMVARLEKERDEARRKASALNGCRNQMANAFNASDAEAFWAADKRANGLVEEWVPEIAQLTDQRDRALADLAESESKRKETAKDFESAFRLVRQENDHLRAELATAKGDEKS